MDSLASGIAMQVNVVIDEVYKEQLVSNVQEHSKKKVSRWAPFPFIKMIPPSIIQYSDFNSFISPPENTTVAILDERMQFLD